MNYLVKNSIIFLLWIISINYGSAQKYSVSGNISDALSGENISGVNIACGDYGNISNTYGFYTILLKKGNNEITYSYIGYERITLNLQINSDTTINISLKPTSVKIDEQTVKQSISNITRFTGTGYQATSQHERNKYDTSFGRRKGYCSLIAISTRCKRWE